MANLRTPFKFARVIREKLLFLAVAVLTLGGALAAQVRGDLPEAGDLPSAPEIDLGLAGSALVLLIGGVLILTDRRRRTALKPGQ